METIDANTIGEHPNMASGYGKVFQALTIPLQGKEEYKDSCYHLPSSIQASNGDWVRGSL